MDKSVETNGSYTPSKKVIGSRVIPKPSPAKGGFKRDLATMAGVAGVATGGILAGLHPDQAKDAIKYAEHIRPQSIVREAKESLEERYSQLVDTQDKGAEKEILVPEANQTDADIDLLYPGLTDEEKTELNVQLQTERQIVKEQYIPDVSMENVEALSPLIEQSAKNEGVPRDILFGMILIESKFDPYNFNKDSGAKGLTQMMDSMAEEHGLSISGAVVADETYDKYADVDDRYKPEIILPATASELAQSYARWGDWGLAAWEWHAGAKNIYSALQIYVFNKYGESLPNAIGVEDDVLSAQIAQQYRDKITQDKINLLRLLNNPAVRAEFSGPEWDNTLIYVMRALAAIKEYRAKAGQNPHAIVDLQELPKAA